MAPPAEIEADLREHANKDIFESGTASVGARPPLMPVEWIGSSRNDLREMPEDVKNTFGYALHEAQRGKHHLSAKKLKGDLRGLIELVDDFDGNTYRAVYTAKLDAVVYVLHVFQKKASHGIATPQREITLIKARWRRARQHHATHYRSKDSQ